MGGCVGIGEYIDSIYTLDNFNQTSNIKWIKRKQTLPKKMSDFGVIIYKHFLFIFGGSVNDMDGYSDLIYYCDIQSYSWHKSYIKCPIKGINYAVLTKINDKNYELTLLILFGYFRMILIEHG